MQPYQHDPQAQYGMEQDYQSLPEDQAHPVFWRRRRRDIDFIFPIVIPCCLLRGRRVSDRCPLHWKRWHAVIPLAKA